MKSVPPCFNDYVKTLVGVALRGHPSLRLRFPAKVEVPEDGVATECHPYKIVFTVSTARWYWLRSHSDERWQRSILLIQINARQTDRSLLLLRVASVM